MKLVGFFLGESMKKLLVVLALGLSFASTSQAFIRLEPYVGYEMGNGSNEALTFETKGINAGARLGWLNTNEKLWIVLDYEMTFDGSLDYGDGSGREELKKTIIAAVFGYNFLENPWRVWAGYGMDEWALKDSNGTTFKGNAMKFGIGYTRYKPMSVNFVYFSENITEV
jgi:hypothetical protein